MTIERPEPKDEFKNTILKLKKLKSEIEKLENPIKKAWEKISELQKEKLEESTLKEVKDIIKSDYKNLNDEVLSELNIKLDGKKEELMECWSKYEELKGPKPKFLPFFMWYLWYNVCSDKNDYLSVVDYSMGAKSNRLFLINMKTNEVEINTTCMQWQWRNWVQIFSNQNESWQSSIGLMQISSERDFRDERTYGWVQPYKENDEKLIVYWKEEWFNDNVWNRYIYMHTWDASKWCFTLPQNNIWHDILKKMAFWGVIMSFYPDAKYLKKTNLLS